MSRRGESRFDREDALACADVLGAFGVTSDHVRARVDGVSGDAGEPADGASDGSLADALTAALASPTHPVAFLRRTIASGPRGVDAPARFWTTAPVTQLGDVFAALDWTFDVSSAYGRSLAVDDAEPYRLRVEDADGRSRASEFAFPETPLGSHNYPALVHALNDDLLFGLDCRFVQLADGTDRWRFALVETAELERVRDRFGDELAVFDRPLLAADQPAAYAPSGDDDGTGIPLPDWVREPDECSWRGRRVTGFDTETTAAGRGRDESSANGCDRDEPGASGRGRDEAAASSREAAADAIEFAEASSDGPDTPDEDRPRDATGQERRSSAGAAGGEARESDSAGAGSDPAGAVAIRDADDDHAEDDPVDDDHAEDDPVDDDHADWSIGGSVDATTRQADPGETGAETAAVAADDDATDEFEWGLDAGPGTGGDASDDGSESDADAGDDESGVGADAGDEGPVTAVDADDTGEDDGFFSSDAVASFDAGAETSRVEVESFGVDAAEPSEDDEYAAVGAAIAAPAGISVDGLLDDEGFLPELPRAEPSSVRIEFDDDFDPDAGSLESERETEDGFVWVNEDGGVDETRHSALD